MLKKLNVRQTEKIVKRLNAVKLRAGKNRDTINLFKYEKKLNEKLNVPIKIVASNDDFHGKISIRFQSQKELDRLINLIIEE